MTRHARRLGGARAVLPRLVASLSLTIACGGAGEATVDVRLGERHQVMQGWEGLLGGTPECNQTAWNAVREQVLDLAVDDVGLNRVKLPLRSGYEDSTDHFGQYMRGAITFDQWKYTWFRPVNDDADPRHANPRGFQWAFLDHVVETQVLPMQRRLRARGDSLWLNLVYVGGRNTPHGESPEEYAELVEQTFLHLRDRFRLVPASLDVINEPNMRNAWTAAQVGRALVAAKARLAAAGFSPQFIGPSTTTMQAAHRFLDSILLVPGAREGLTDVSYHRYGGNAAVLKGLAARADSLGYRTVMSEKMGADQATLFEDLTVGNVSSWQQFAMVFCAAPGEGDGGGIYVRVSQDDTLHPTARLTPIARFLRQYFRYVHLGAVRVGAAADDPRMRATAFLNPNQRAVVVVQGDGARALAIRGLPAGRYSITMTTTGASDVAPPDTVIAVGGVLRTRLPALGVLTVFGR